jgi:dipeptidase E
LLLISNTGRPYFEHCSQQLLEFWGGGASIAFITAASLGDEVAYFEKVRDALLGLASDGSQGPVADVRHLRWDSDDITPLLHADSILVGGGNTYVLLKRLHETGLLEEVRQRVLAGIPYVGVSAGGNIAGPNILTTNDWNVVGSTVFEGLELVPFNVNPHYVGRGTSEGPTGESRDDRIHEYHLVRSNPVIGLEEEGVVSVSDGEIVSLGIGRARLFRPDRSPEWLPRNQPVALDGASPARSITI